jgi:pheromone shutdown protein TraB
MGQGNQERLDLYAGKVGGQRKNALQNGPAFNQAAGTGLAFLVALLVLQNLLSVFKLPNLLQDFLPFFFCGWAVIFSFMSGTSFLWKYS